MKRRQFNSLSVGLSLQVKFPVLLDQKDPLELKTVIVLINKISASD